MRVRTLRLPFLNRSGPSKTGTSGKANTLAATFLGDRRGSYAVYGAIVIIPLIIGAAVAVEYADASRLRSELQQVLDAAVLAGAQEEKGQVAAAENFFAGYFVNEIQAGRDIAATFALGDGELNGEASRPMQMMLGLSFLTSNHTIAVASQARFSNPDNPPCITVLANTAQALLVNSGAGIDATKCEIHVHSQKTPAVMMNSGSTLDIAKLCVKGTKIQNNGGKISNEETRCDALPDPYAGKIEQPTVPAKCTTEGSKDGNRTTLRPGLHCYVNLNGSQTITFEPGLHIIRGHMNINSGSTVIAEGVTFYFENTGSQIQANGNLKMTATAPKQGKYKGILMFEKTSDATNNANKTNFVFNGSLGEKLEGVIHLPNRNLIYNSKTNIQSNKIAIVANTLIINQAAWKFDSYDNGSGGTKIVYLSR